jgi:1A family penicillin-binding protein
VDNPDRFLIKSVLNKVLAFVSLNLFGLTVLLLNFKLRLSSIYLKLKHKSTTFIKQAQVFLQKFYKKHIVFSLRRFGNLQFLKKIKAKSQFLIRFIRNKFQTLNQYKFPQLQIKLKSFFQKKYKPIYFSLITTTLILSLAWWSYNFIFRDLPDPLELTQKRQIMTTRILDRNGNLLFRIYEDENRTLVPLSQISQHMINATLAIEDKNFYQHHGFSVQGIFRALVNNLKKQELQGGSTITQQLIKNRLLSPDKTLRRKLRELILSILVESTYTKDQILTMYLNEVSYGGSTYGVEEAAWQYFNKPAKDLTLGESAMLAGLPAAPSVYTPFGANPELSNRRQEEVLRRMVEDSYISLEEAYLAQQEELQLRKNVIDIKSPHFVMYVRKLLAEKFGEQTLQQGGLEVRTSLDLNLQQQTEAIVQEEVRKVESLNINNGAALVTNPQTGEILAMVGSKDYFDFENDGQVNVTIRPRQPGSAIKPLTYALAFEQGYKPWSYIEDSPITYHIPGSKLYSPRNYDNRFHGKVTLKQALANSYNVPAVKLLANLGVENLVEKGQEMGISTWNDSSRFGLSLTLGAGEVLMSDLAEVYGAFATGGYKVELDPFLEIRDHQGKVLYRNSCYDQPESCRQQSVLDPLAAYWITDILSDNQARAQTFGLYSLLYIPNQQVAVKTGTTNSMRDNWTIGYTSDRLISVWVGNNDNQPMSYVASGMTGASPIWNRVTRLLLRSDEPHQFVLPDNLVKIKICAPTNTLPCQGCPHVVEAIFKKGEEPQKACNSSYFVKKDQQPRSKPPGERSQIL